MSNNKGGKKSKHSEGSKGKIANKRESQTNIVFKELLDSTFSNPGPTIPAKTFEEKKVDDLIIESQKMRFLESGVLEGAKHFEEKSGEMKVIPDSKYFKEEEFQKIKETTDPLRGIYLSKNWIEKKTGLHPSDVSRATQVLEDMNLIKYERPIPGKANKFWSVDNSGYIGLVIDTFQRSFFKLSEKEQESLESFLVTDFLPSKLYEFVENDKENPKTTMIPFELVEAMREFYLDYNFGVLDSEVSKMKQGIAERIYEKHFKNNEKIQLWYREENDDQNRFFTSIRETSKKTNDEMMPLIKKTMIANEIKLIQNKYTEEELRQMEDEILHFLDIPKRIDSELQGVDRERVEKVVKLVGIHLDETCAYGTSEDKTNLIEKVFS